MKRLFCLLLCTYVLLNCLLPPILNEKQSTEFLIAGDDNFFLPAEVKLEKNRIVIWDKQIPNPAAVRFSFQQHWYVECI